MVVPAESRFDAFTARLKVPAIAAPMFLVSGPGLVRSTALAGMAAAFPAPNARTLEELDSWMGSLRQDLGDRHAPWVVNVVAHNSYSRMKDEIDLILKHQPSMVITALGSPRRVLDAVHSYGGLVFADVIDAGFARKCVDAGVDGLVLVCAGAGGHTGQLSPFAFIPAVRSFFKGPIVAGGAVTSGQAIRDADAGSGPRLYRHAVHCGIGVAGAWRLQGHAGCSNTRRPGADFRGHRRARELAAGEPCRCRH